MKKITLLFVLVIMQCTAWASLPPQLLPLLDHLISLDKQCPLTDQNCRQTNQAYEKLTSLGYCLQTQSTIYNINSWSQCPATQVARDNTPETPMISAEPQESLPASDQVIDNPAQQSIVPVETVKQTEPAYQPDQFKKSPVGIQAAPEPVVATSESTEQKSEKGTFGTCCIVIGIFLAYVGMGKSDRRYASGVRGGSSGLLMFGLGLGLMGLVIIIIPETLLFTIIVVGTCATMFYWLYKAHSDREAQRLVEQQISSDLAQALSIVDEHRDELKRRRRQLTVAGNYGLVDHKKWHAEKELFLNSVIANRMGAMPAGSLKVVWDHIDIATDGFQSDIAGFEEQMNGIDYEHLVSDNLKLLGWSTVVTKGSGDQGIDIVGTKKSVRIVVQCKRYSNYVDNKAVQEAFTGKAFEGTDFAVVVSNARFSNSAKQLASATGVILLHHSELMKLDKLCGLLTLT